MMSKIQNLNGTHNRISHAQQGVSVVYDVKDTKFEWNSQHGDYDMVWAFELFMMSKIQNLNGTHNTTSARVVYHDVVYDVKDTKFEWNSQRVCKGVCRLDVVYDVKDTKFEWNSQPT